MATLEAGVQYGLRSNFNENKNLLFVKLTDSAQRHILNYINNQHLISQKPTIQVGGNEGRLCIPSVDGHGNSFTFSLSGNQDIEGPSGGFECIQQTGPKGLESLGTIPYKMRIHANDDVYETTRHRMVIAEENNKNKCTRVIKANAPNIGRKVKVTGTGRTIPPPSNTRHRESSTSTSQAKRSPSYKPTISNMPEKKLPDIMRRPLKERLIHLLALRPFKRPELYDRLNKEGMRERERPIMTTLLRQVAFMRDNTYHLQRHMWNDVQEDWPFYTEQEKAMLRRRKPQNLTPPGSSDGSTGSGQSPNSIQPGSPPAITAPPPSLLNSNKRPGYYQGNDGLPTKKPRISHYRKSETNPCSSNAGESGRTASGNRGVSPTAGGVHIGSNSANSSSGNSGGGAVRSWDQKQQRERRSDCRSERTSNSNSDVTRGGSGYGAAGGGSRSCQVSPSDSTSSNHIGYGSVATISGNAGSNSFNTTSGSHNSHNSPAYSNSMNSGGGGGGGGSDRHYYAGRSAISGDNSACGGGIDNTSRFVTSSARSDSGLNINTGSRSSSPSSVNTDRRDRSDRSRTSAREERDLEFRTKSSADGAGSYIDNAGVTSSAPNRDLPIITESSESSPILESTQASDSNIIMGSPVPLLENSQVPDYLTYYTRISNIEQRRRYKLAFNAQYKEYRKVHAKVAEVSKRFMLLNEQMSQQKKSGNRSEYERLRQQIMTEYNQKKNDPEHLQTREQFNYLHNKLSHIKQLVDEFDRQNAATCAMSTTSKSDSCSKENKDVDSRHY